MKKRQSIEGGSPDTPNLKEYDSIIDEANAFFGIK
jgi:D-amino-acid oxidase